MGRVPGESQCTGACATRDAWLLRRDEMYDLEGLSGLLAEGEPHSTEMLALSIGATRRLPKRLSLKLANSFVLHWGEWSVKRRGAADAGGLRG